MHQMWRAIKVIKWDLRITSHDSSLLREITRITVPNQVSSLLFTVTFAMTDTRQGSLSQRPVSYTHLRAHETPEHLVCRLLLEKKKKKQNHKKNKPNKPKKKQYNNTHKHKN